MRTTLDDAAVVDQDDLIGLPDGGLAMRDDGRGMSVHQRFQRIPNQLFRLPGERGRGAVEYQD